MQLIDVLRFLLIPVFTFWMGVLASEMWHYAEFEELARLRTENEVLKRTIAQCPTAAPKAAATQLALDSCANLQIDLQIARADLQKARDETRTARADVQSARKEAREHKDLHTNIAIIVSQLEDANKRLNAEVINAKIGCAKQAPKAVPKADTRCAGERDYWRGEAAACQRRLDKCPYGTLR